MALQGDLRHLSLVNLIQINCTEQNRACLRLRSQKQDGAIYFEAGEIVHAVLGTQTGEEAVYELLTWQDGEFALEMDEPAPDHTVFTPWSNLLLDGVRRMDEGDAAWSELVESEPEPVEEAEEMAEKLDAVLKQLAGEVSGFVATAVIGMDGLGIAQYQVVKGVDVDNINAQMTLLLKLVDTTVGKLGAGVLEDHLLTTERAYLLMRFLPGKEYYLGIAADIQKASLGNMRLVSKLYAERIAKAMPR